MLRRESFGSVDLEFSSGYKAFGLGLQCITGRFLPATFGWDLGGKLLPCPTISQGGFELS